jgi:hypothetical protein
MHRKMIQVDGSNIFILGKSEKAKRGLQERDYTVAASAYPLSFFRILVLLCKLQAVVIQSGLWTAHRLCMRIALFVRSDSFACPFGLAGFLSVLQNQFIHRTDQ